MSVSNKKEVQFQKNKGRKTNNVRNGWGEEGGRHQACRIGDGKNWEGSRSKGASRRMRGGAGQLASDFTSHAHSNYNQGPNWKKHIQLALLSAPNPLTAIRLIISNKIHKFLSFNRYWRFAQRNQRSRICSYCCERAQSSWEKAKADITGAPKVAFSEERVGNEQTQVK